MTTTTTTTTPAERLLETLCIEPDHTAAALTDSKTAMLSWAGRDGRYTLDDLEAILKGHGETLRAWVDDCDAHGFDDVYNAEALLTWLGY
jgi:hypothetical protein